MLKPLKENKQLLLWIVAAGMYGILGWLIIPIAIYLTKSIDRHPKVWDCILGSAFVIIWIQNMFFAQEPNYPLIIVFSALMLNRILD